MTRRRSGAEGRPLQAKEESKDEKTIAAETCSDEIPRVLDLPAAEEAAKGNAMLKDGILELDMAKAAPAKTVKGEAKAVKVEGQTKRCLRNAGRESRERESLNDVCYKGYC
jgi:hypothetical protein